MGTSLGSGTGSGEPRQRGGVVEGRRKTIATVGKKILHGSMATNMMSIDCLRWNSHCAPSSASYSKGIFKGPT